jgi:carbamoyl-phosphate synthase small subunit
MDLAKVVTTHEPYEWTQGSWGLGKGFREVDNARFHVVAYDYGIKRNILRLFEEQGCRVTVVPSTTPAEKALEMEPDGVFFSNGPGDPAAVSYAPETIRTIAENEVPVFGICLGHQLIALSFGGSTEKLPYGHRGGNHPVKELETGRVLITSQNHGFAVSGDKENPREIPGAPDLEVTHLNLNDGTVEGLKHKSLPVFAVQYHPEAAPGPHDARPLFSEFMKAVRTDVGTGEPTA